MARSTFSGSAARPRRTVHSARPSVSLLERARSCAPKRCTDGPGRPACSWRPSSLPAVDRKGVGFVQFAANGLVEPVFVANIGSGLGATGSEEASIVGRLQAAAYPLDCRFLHAAK